MKRKSVLLGILALYAALAAFFALLFYADNKYETPPPYGKNGQLILNEQNLSGSRPLFLIDGWLLSDNRVKEQPTWVGEFPNLQRGDVTVPPHGGALYQLTLQYTGTSKVVAVEFPELFSRYAISLDGETLARGSGSGEITFLLTPGNHTLMVETMSELGYYSGMYYPPALGTPATLTRIQNVRSLAYALVVLVPLALALFTLVLWRTGGALSRWFGLLCCCYALYVSYYFVQLFHLPVFRCWFLVENLALYGLCFCVVRLTALAAEGEHDKGMRWVGWVMVLLPGGLLTLCLLIPVLPWAVAVHGVLTDLYYLFTFCCTAFFAARKVLHRGAEYCWTLGGCAVFGMGLLCNLFASNSFEPIYFFWQFEWCGLFLVALFTARMVARNRRILAQNAELTQHLEQVVEARTEELNHLLQERKAFFSDMAHDLKAPVFATQSFIAAIRGGGIGVDGELSRYLDLAEGKQREMARRLQGLSTINALDRIEGERVNVSLRTLMQEIYAAHHAEAEVASVHLVVEPPEEDSYLWAQPEKLEILFENLIYNALRATPGDGCITVSAKRVGYRVQITVADTGCGIPEEELHLVFRRFYVGRRNRDIGTGLGLYIVQTIVEELGGDISVSSILGEGTSFLMNIPLSESPALDEAAPAGSSL